MEYSTGSALCCTLVLVSCVNYVDLILKIQKDFIESIVYISLTYSNNSGMCFTFKSLITLYISGY